MPAAKKKIDEDFALSSLHDHDEDLCYSVIPFQKRIQLIEKVCLEGSTILRAGQELEIKDSTAKYIVRCYRQKGLIMKKFEGDKIEKEQAQKRIKELKNKEKQLKEEKKRKQKREKMKSLNQDSVVSIKSIDENKINSEKSNESPSAFTQYQRNKTQNSMEIKNEDENCFCQMQRWNVPTICYFLPEANLYYPYPWAYRSAF